MRPCTSMAARRSRLRVSVVLLVLAGLACGSAERQRVLAERDGGFADVTIRGREQRVDVRSPKGIGAADIPLTAQRPRALELVFHLQALEQLRLKYDAVAIDVAVQSDGEVHQWGSTAGAGSAPITPGDSLWMPVRIVRRDATDRTSPITTIHVSASPRLGTTSAASLRIEWVDFLR